MSLVFPRERGEWWVPQHSLCSFCGCPVPSHEVAVFWAAFTNLFLHGACARQLGTHLICDSREAELAGGDAAFWRSRAIQTVRERLERGEVTA